MRILKASAVALALSLALGAGVASAADLPVAPPAKHHWVHGEKTHFLHGLLWALFHHEKKNW